MSNIISQHLAVKQQMLSPGAPFEVIRVQRNGHDVLAYKNAQGSLADVINLGRQHGEKLFLQYQQESWTFDRFFSAVDHLTGLLQYKFELGKGDKIAIAMRNRPEWLIAFCAIINLGGTAVPLNSWGKSEELHQGLEDSQAKFVICDGQRHAFINPKSFGIKALLVEGAKSSDSSTYLYQDLLQETHEPVAVDINADDAAILMFTSGTGGRPKGALFSHFNCVQALFNIDYIGATTYMTHTDRMNALLAGAPSKTLLAVPLFHISGLFSQGISNLKGGRSIYMMYKWDAEEAIQIIQREKVTVLMGAPSMMMDVLSHPEFKNIDVSNITNISAGGAGTPSKLNQLYGQVIPNTMAGAGWGLTETAGTGAAFTGDGFKEHPTASGFVSPIIELKFCDEEGHELNQGEVGEIYIKSASCVSHYLNGAGADDFIDGWFKTGDIGYVDDNGLIYLCDRAKDMIIRGGENIYPVEVENCLLHHPECIESAVIGIADEAYGESVAAVVVRQDNATCTEADLKAFCAEHLAGFKVPVKIVFSDQPLPRNATRKLLKKQIKQMFFGQ